MEVEEVVRVLKKTLVVVEVVEIEYQCLDAIWILIVEVDRAFPSFLNGVVLDMFYWFT